MGLSGIDPSTGQPWGSYKQALEALERSRAIAARQQAIMDDKGRAILECRRAGLSVRATAAKTGMAISAVHRRFREMRPGLSW
jgi:hypothetical protein